MNNYFDTLINEITPSDNKEIEKAKDIKVFSVYEISSILKELLETSFHRIKIKGEIQGLKIHSSGTYYFDLKESFGGKDYILNCVLWKWTKISTKIEEGLEVVITGKITAYTGRSSYQIIIEEVEIAGIGALLKLIEERKQKLSAEGLFDINHKKQIPYLPNIIGVVTSETGAVIQDIIHRITDRFPTRIIIYPVAVQGENADKQITTAINNFNKITDSNRPDVLIIARGGGSVQDLMPFNEENVVRAVYNSKIPIISAVGHETDTTLIDYVSDLRAPTPTGAAEKAVPVKSDLIKLIKDKENNLFNSIKFLFNNIETVLKTFSYGLKNPMQIITDYIQRLDDKTSKLNLLIKNIIKNNTDKILYNSKMLESYSFKNVLKRGYSIIWNKNKLITNKEDLKKTSIVTIEFLDGKLDFPTNIKNIKSNKKEKTNNINKQGNLF